jgi:hypothetical protein
LGIVNAVPNSISELSIGREHQRWLNDFSHALSPTEAHLAAFALNYALTIRSNETLQNEQDICSLLDTAFSRLAPHGPLTKIRGNDLVLFFLCFHAPALFYRIRHRNKLFPRPVIECEGRIYEVNAASRSTQSFIVCQQTRGK